MKLFEKLWDYISFKLFGNQKNIEELFLEDIPTVVQRYIPSNLCEEWDKSYDDHVKKITPKTHHRYAERFWNGNTWEYIDKRPGFVLKAKRNVKSYEAAQKSVYYDVHGFRYSWTCDKWVYNPMYDQSITDEQEVIEMIRTMDEDEVAAAFQDWEDKFQKFEGLYEKAKASKATKVQAIIGVVQ